MSLSGQLSTLSDLLLSQGPAGKKRITHNAPGLSTEDFRQHQDSLSVKQKQVSIRETVTLLDLISFNPPRAYIS